MRLWHQDLITQLPDWQLRGQHRECCALRGKGWGRKHSTVDYVFKHPYMHLFQYHMVVMFEMKQRGMHTDEIWANPHYRGKTVGYDYSFDHHEPCAIGNIYTEHNEEYMEECLENLRNKGVLIDNT